MTALLNVELKYIFLQHPCRVRYDWSNNHNLAMVRSIELASSWRCIEGVWVEDHGGLTVPNLWARTALDSGFLFLVPEHRAPFPTLPGSPNPPPTGSSLFSSIQNGKIPMSLHDQDSASILLGTGKRTSWKEHLRPEGAVEGGDGGSSADAVSEPLFPSLQQWETACSSEASGSVPLTPQLAMPLKAEDRSPIFICPFHHSSLRGLRQNASPLHLTICFCKVTTEAWY